MPLNIFFSQVERKINGHNSLSNLVDKTYSKVKKKIKKMHFKQKVKWWHLIKESYHRPTYEKKIFTDHIYKCDTHVVVVMVVVIIIIELIFML